MLDTGIKDLLLRIAQDSDLVSYKKIYFLYYERLLNLACSIVRPSEAGEEIVDDVFVKIWQNRADLENINNLTVYLYVAVKNKAINYNAANRIDFVDIESIDFELKDFSSSAEDMMITDELAKVINSTVKQLPASCKMVFKLVKEDGLKYREAAEILNISVKTVEYHISNALKTIAAAISLYSNEDARAFKKVIPN
jgi:RNA polymerase sigma-70 factor (family 1)